MHEWAKLAYLVKPKGLNGGLVVRSIAGLPFLLEEGMEVAFVPPVLDAPRNARVLECRDLTDDVFLVSFSTVSTIDDAQALAGCYCLVRRECLPSNFEELAEPPLAGFEVYDEVHGLVGEIVDFLDNGAQQLLVCEGAYGEVLIPFVDAIVLDIDPEQFRVETRLPAGLIDIADAQ